MFNITHHYHTKKAKLPTGETVHRQEKLFVPEMNAEVPCAPYDDHFIYHTVQPGPAYKCTCGSLGVTAMQGKEFMWVCMHHATEGVHATGGSQWL